jgi:hypothetical protein
MGKSTLIFPGNLADIHATAQMYCEAKTISMNETFVDDQGTILQTVFASPDFES